MHIKKSIIVLICFMAAGYGVYTWLRRQIAPTVWTVAVDVKPSPKARWRAWVDETVVEDGPMSSVVDEVRLLDLHDYDKIVDVLAVDTGGMMTSGRASPGPLLTFYRSLSQIYPI